MGNVATEAKDAAKSKAVSHETMLFKAEAEAAAAINAAKEARAALEKARPDVTCECAFGDAGVKLGGPRVAKLNPMRWSGGIPLMVAIQQLQEVQQQIEVATRAIIVRVPPGVKGKQMRFGSCAEAVLHLDGFCTARTRACEVCDAANAAKMAAEARVGDAEAAVAESEKELDAAVLTLSEAAESAARAEEGLERAKTHAAQAQKGLQEFYDPFDR